MLLDLIVYYSGVTFQRVDNKEFMKHGESFNNNRKCQYGFDPQHPLYVLMKKDTPIPKKKFETSLNP